MARQNFGRIFRSVQGLVQLVSHCVRFLVFDCNTVVPELAGSYELVCWVFGYGM
jgi:hypothetical protein